MNLSTALSLVSTTALVVGVLFAALQIRNVGRVRAREAELLLAHSLQTPTFLDAWRLIAALPEGLGADELAAHVGQNRNLIAYWTGTMESLGVLVHHREISLAIVDDFFGGPILITWRKLRRYVEEDRARLDRETIHEWFQWLAERLIEREGTAPPVPAYIAEREWRA